MLGEGIEWIKPIMVELWHLPTEYLICRHLQKFADYRLRIFDLQTFADWEYLQIADLQIENIWFADWANGSPGLALRSWEWRTGWRSTSEHFTNKEKLVKEAHASITQARRSWLKKHMRVSHRQGRVEKEHSTNHIPSIPQTRRSWRSTCERVIREGKVQQRGEQDQSQRVQLFWKSDKEFCQVVSSETFYVLSFS